MPCLPALVTPLRHVALIILTLWAAAAQAISYGPVLSDADGNKSAIETSGMTRKGYIVYAWQLVNFEQPKDNAVLSARSQIEFDCRFKQSRIMWVILHSDRDGAGDVIRSAAISAPVWEKTVAGSVAADQLEFACRSIMR
jgi:hypothetical protein